MVDNNGLPYPTNATITINWGDGTAEDVKEFFPSPFQYSHDYDKAGDYDIKVAIENIISKKTDITKQVREIL